MEDFGAPMLILHYFLPPLGSWCRSLGWKKGYRCNISGKSSNHHYEYVLPLLHL